MPKGGNNNGGGGNGGKGPKPPKIVAQAFDTPEGPADGTLLGMVVADVKPSKSIWSILSGNNDGAFSIDPATGELYVADGSAVDYEAEQTRNLVVQVVENGKKAYSATVTVSISDVNEAPSAGPDVVASFAETVDQITVLASLAATDPDTLADSDSDPANDGFNDLTYAIAITGGDTDDLFEIDANGNISLAAGKTLDYETAQQHVLEVAVTDGGGLSDTAQVTVNVSDVNEAPSAGPDVAVSVAEAVDEITILASIAATDPDTLADSDADGTNDSFNDLSYAITGGDPDGLFEIDANGNISLAAGKTLDYETIQQHVLEVTATDGGGLSDTAEVVIRPPPVINLAIENLLINGSFDAGAASWTLSGDAQVANSQLVFGSDGAAEQSIAGLVSGSLYQVGTFGVATTAPNFIEVRFSDIRAWSQTATSNKVSVSGGSLPEQSGSFGISVSANGGTGTFQRSTFFEYDSSMTATLSVIGRNISVTDVTFEQIKTVATVDEHAGEGTLVGILDAHEPGATYSLSSLYFDLNGDEFSVAAPYIDYEGNVVKLDYEEQTSHPVTVRITDDAGNFRFKTFQIAVRDSNEAPSAGPDVAVSVAETVDDTAILASVAATDPDTLADSDADGTNDTFNDLSYAITSGDSDGLFEIDADGNVSLAAGKTLDFERSQKHILEVTVTDGGGLSDTAEVTVNVTDVDIII